MAYRTMDETVEPLAHLGACGEWNDGIRLIASAVVQAALVEPADPVKCGRVQLRILAARYDELMQSLDGAEAEIAKEAFGSLFLSALPLISRGSAQAYDKALAFDRYHAVTGKRGKGRRTKGKKYGSHIRDILTAGLVVFVMRDSASRSDGPWMGPDKAKERIGELFQSELPNALFVMSNKEMSAAWREYRRFAHLAAALLLFICKKGWTRFRSKERQSWRQEVEVFLSYAQFFQNFLNSLGDRGELAAKKQAHLRASFDLVQLPSALEIAPWSPSADENLIALLPSRANDRHAKAPKNGISAVSN